MSKKELMKLCGSSIKTFVKEHQVPILTSSTILFNAAGIVATYKNSPKIHAVIDDWRSALDEIDLIEDITNDERKIKRREVTITALKRLAPLVSPIIIFFVGSTASSIIVSKKYKNSQATIANLTSALALAKTTIDDYGVFEEKVIDELGEDKYREVKEEITRKKIEETAPDQTVVPMGEYLCYIPDFDIYFSGTKDKINLAMERVNAVLGDNGRTGKSYGYLSKHGNEIVRVADLLEELDTRRSPKMCDSLGWDAGEVKEVRYWIGSGQTSTGVPYLTLEFYTRAEFIDEYY